MALDEAVPGVKAARWFAAGALAALTSVAAFLAAAVRGFREHGPN